jgi:hypothetical protein
MEAMMVGWRYATVCALALLATASHAGIPIQEKKVCPVGGQKFETLGTVSCSTYGLTQDFFLKRPSSCDFVTRLPQCPDNKLPLYKEFTPDEVKLLETYVASEEYLAMENRSRFYIARKIDDFLVSKGSARVMDFSYLLGGLQHDRERTESDSEYRQWVMDAGKEEIGKADAGDHPYIRMLMAYTAYLGGQFDEASSLLETVKADASIKGNALVTTYVARVEQCVEAKDSSLCPSSDYVMPEGGRR